MARIRVENLDQLAKFGQFLGQLLIDGKLKGIFLTGPLGCGKTALTRKIVETLPGSEECDISSPSFTIYNRYPTFPPIIHCDLYKCKTQFPQEILDYWHDKNEILIMEWAEYFPSIFRIEPTLDLFFNIDNDLRYLNMDENAMSILALSKNIEYLDIFESYK